MGNAEIMKYETVVKDNPSILQSIDNIIKATESAEFLTNQLLSLSKTQTEENSLVEVSHFINNFYKMVKRITPPSIEIELLIEEQQDLIFIGSKSLEQLILNLFLNSKESLESTNGGKITIEKISISIDLLKNHLNSSEYKFIGNRKIHEVGLQNEFVMISVEDNGSGIPKDKITTIFEPFYTNKIKGTGLGLGICQEIVERYNGYLTVSSNQNSTNFSIFFPKVTKLDTNLLLSNTEEIMNTDNHMEKPKDKKILVVDDKKEILDIFSKFGQHLEYEIQLEHDPMIALNYYKTHWEDIEIVILDVLMPGMDGLQFYEKISKVNSEQKLIFMSGYTSDVNLDKIIRQSQISFLSKPIKYVELKETIQNLNSYDGK